MKNRFFYCRRATLFALLSLLSLLQFSCDLEESCLDPSADCFVAGSLLFVSSVPAASDPINAGFNKVKITFSKKISNIASITDKKAYSLSGAGAAGFSIDKIVLVDDTTIEVKLKGNVSEGPIQLDFSKLKDRGGNALKGTTSISFTNDYKATLTLKSSTTVSQVAVTGSANTITITSPSDVTLTQGSTTTTITHAGANAIKVEIESSSSYTVNVSTAAVTGAGGSASVSVTYPTTTTTTTNLSNFVTPPTPPGTTTTTTTTTTTDSTAQSTATTGRFTTTTGKITITTTGGTITTTGGTITTTGGTITTKYAQLKWSTNLKNAKYHIGKKSSDDTKTCPLRGLPSGPSLSVARLQENRQFAEGFPNGDSNTNRNVSGKTPDGTGGEILTIINKGTGYSHLKNGTDREITTVINAENLRASVGDSAGSENNLIICVEKPNNTGWLYETFKVSRH